MQNRQHAYPGMSAASKSVGSLPSAGDLIYGMLNSLDPIFTTHDAAALLGVHPSTVAKWIDSGTLKAFKTLGGHRRIAATELRECFQAAGREVPPELQSVEAKLNVLVIDDEPATLRAIKLLFKPFAGQVSLSMMSSGIEALIWVGVNRPDAVLIDINMPGLDGFEVCRSIRKYEQLEKVVVILMTGNRSEAGAAEAVTAGAAGCLAKPLAAEEVLTLIRRTRRRTAPR